MFYLILGRMYCYLQTIIYFCSVVRKGNQGSQFIVFIFLHVFHYLVLEKLRHRICVSELTSRSNRTNKRRKIALEKDQDFERTPGGVNTLFYQLNAFGFLSLSINKLLNEFPSIFQNFLLPYKYWYKYPELQAHRKQQTLLPYSRTPICS